MRHPHTVDAGSEEPEESLAADRRRPALLDRDIDRDRAEDPGRTRTQASRWLGASSPRSRR
jgi:hypothetical protein